MVLELLQCCTCYWHSSPAGNWCDICLQTSRMHKRTGWMQLSYEGEQRAGLPSKSVDKSPKLAGCKSLEGVGLASYIRVPRHQQSLSVVVALDCFNMLDDVKLGRMMSKRTARPMQHIIYASSNNQQSKQIPSNSVVFNTVHHRSIQHQHYYMVACHCTLLSSLTSVRGFERAATTAAVLVCPHRQAMPVAGVL